MLLLITTLITIILLLALSLLFFMINIIIIVFIFFYCQASSLFLLSLSIPELADNPFLCWLVRDINISGKAQPRMVPSMYPHATHTSIRQKSPAMKNTGKHPSKKTFSPNRCILVWPVFDRGSPGQIGLGRLGVRFEVILL